MRRASLSSFRAAAARVWETPAARATSLAARPVLAPTRRSMRVRSAALSAGDDLPTTFAGAHVPRAPAPCLLGAGRRAGGLALASDLAASDRGTEAPATGEPARR